MKTVYLKDYQAPFFAVEKVHLTVQLFEECALIHSALKIKKINPNAQTLILNGKNLTTESVLKNGEKTPYQIIENNGEMELHLDFKEDFSTVETKVKIFPAQNTALLGFYKTQNGYVTQCEAESFRAITWFLDRPDVMSVYSVRLEADSKQFPILLSNGNLEKTGQLENGRHFAQWLDPFKKPSYLFAMVFADLGVLTDSYTTLTGKKIDLYIYTEKGKTQECHFAMNALKKSMRWDEKTFGLECDLKRYSIVAVDDFNMGAMENKGLNIFNSKFVLANEETATDADIEAVEDVIAHEYFHNWTGNRVTCRDWFQLSLKEGLTVFREQLFSSDVHDPALSRIKEARLLKNTQFPEDSSPMAHPVRPDHYVEINNFYTATVYEKGAELIRMIQTLIGKETFKKGLAEYFRLFDGTAATIEDFIFAMQQVSHFDFSPFMPWYHTPGTPLITAETELKENGFALTLTQENPHSSTPVLMPISLALFKENGEKIEERTLLFKEKKETYFFENVEKAPILSLLRNFSAPVKLKMPFSTEEAIFLLKNEDDFFSAFNAAQKVFGEMILKGKLLPNDFLSALKNLLHHFEKRGAGFVAEVLNLPSLPTLSQELEKADIQTLHAARQNILRQMAEVLNEDFLKLYQDFNAREKLTPAERALKNRALQFLAEEETPETLCLLQDAFDSAQNMTDSFAVLNIFSNLLGDFPEREKNLNTFLNRWKNNPLIVMKWFSAQAASRRKDTFKQVENLSRHPLFSLENPNKVYALLRQFCANLPCFHTEKAYLFILEKIKQLNLKNPSVAARLLRAFDSYQKFNVPGASLMLHDLEKEALSRDVAEVLSKLLEHSAVNA